MNDTSAADIVFTGDSHYAFISHPTAQHLTMVDVRTLRTLHRIPLGDRPAAMDYSTRADALFVALGESGEVLALAADELENWDGHGVPPQHRLSHAEGLSPEAGVTQLRFAPDGRLGFLLNTRTDQLSILDTANLRVIQRGKMARAPEQIAFSNALAYIRHGESEVVYMLTLDDPDIGREGRPIPVVDAPGGDHAFAGHAPSTPATGIVKAPGASAVLIANPGDRAVYFYKEGMAAPMGQFSNYGRAPRAVVAIDRSLREYRQPGVYEIIARLPSAGVHDVVFFLDNPRILHCFTLAIGDDPSQPATPARSLAVTAITPPERLRIGATETLRFRLGQAAAMADTADMTPVPPTTAMDEPAPEVSSVALEAVVTLTSGLWRQRLAATTAADGSFELALRAPVSGYYQIHVTSDDDVALRADNAPVLRLRAE